MCRKPVISPTGRAEQRTRPILVGVSQRHHRVVVSVGTTVCLVFATVAPALLEPQREPPGYALSNSVVFFLEQCLATFLIS